MKLTSRLNAVVGLVTGKSVADIGCDHGKVPIKLILDGVCDKVIAADVNKGPVEACIKNVRANGLTDVIDVRCGDGIKVLETGEVETIIIAGMGGELISTILSEKEDVAKSAKELILQPMTSEEYLREFLQNSGYCIENEILAKEGNKIYVIIRAVKGVSDEYIYFPEKLKVNEKSLIDAYYEKVSKRLKDKIKGSVLDSKPEEEKEYNVILSKVREIYENITNSKNS